MGEIASPLQLRMSFLRWALVAVPLVLLLGVGSGRFSNSGYGNTWFAALDQPAMMPDGWVFGLVWTILYVLMGFGLAHVLQARGARGRQRAVIAFGVQLALNLAWSPLFFLLHKVLAALVLLGLIFVAASYAAMAMYRVRMIAGVLMLPYLAWLIFAAFLNYQVLVLNPGAEMLDPSVATTQIMP